MTSVAVASPAVNVAQTLQAIEAEMNSSLIERAEIVRLALVAVVARQHMLILGPPGTSKSRLITSLANHVAAPGGGGLSHFVYLMTKSTTPNELFGPFSVSKMRDEDQFIRVTTGKIPEAQLVFLDEIFKCVAGDTLLTLPNGERRTMQWCAENTYLPLLLDSMTAFNGIGDTPTKRIIARPPGRVLRLQLASGRSVTATPDHRFYARDGAGRTQGQGWRDWTDPAWLPLGDLRPGMMVATPARLTTEGGIPLPDHELALLGLLLADGGCTQPAQIRYTKSDPTLVALADLTARACGDELVPVEGPSYRFRGGNVSALVERHGIGTKSVDKEIPAAIYRLPAPQLRSFIGTLWSGDGYINPKNGQITYATSSLALAEGLQHLLLRCGILSTRITFTTTDGNSPEQHTAYRLNVHRVSARSFGEQIGVHLVGQQAANLAGCDLTYRGSERRSKVEGHIYWDTVVGITEAGEQPTYCFETTRGNFVANDIVVHNCNSAALNSLLTITNERLFDNGPTRQPVPLISLFGASNELPQGDDLGALWDRFIIRTVVGYVTDGGFAQLLRLPRTAAAPTTISYGDLMTAQEGAALVDVADDTLTQIEQLRRDLGAAGIIPSDRRWVQSLDVLRANAYLDGRSQVDEDDLGLLADVLWQTPDQRAAIKTMTGKVANPLNARAVELGDMAHSVYEAYKQVKDDKSLTEEQKMAKAIETNGKLKKIRGELNKATTEAQKQNASSRVLGRFSKAMKDLEGWQKVVLEDATGA